VNCLALVVGLLFDPSLLSYVDATGHEAMDYDDANNVDGFFSPRVLARSLSPNRNT